MRRFRIIFLGAALAIATLGASSSGVAAYGRADHPLAQIEFSANCNNPGYFLCSPQVFGLGGIWLWIEIDANGTGDVAGAGCGHVRGVGGGAGPIRGDITWTLTLGAQGESFGVDPNDMYYNVSLGGGGPMISFPQTVGHYSFKPAPAVTIQTQVAP
jgi:hypothetical protein